MSTPPAAEPEVSVNPYAPPGAGAVSAAADGELSGAGWARALRVLGDLVATAGALSTLIFTLVLLETAEPPDNPWMTRVVGLGLVVFSGLATAGGLALRRLRPNAHLAVSVALAALLAAPPVGTALAIAGLAMLWAPPARAALAAGAAQPPVGGLQRLMDGLCVIFTMLACALALLRLA